MTLPLAPNDLESDGDWHRLKDLLLACRYKSHSEASRHHSVLPLHLQNHRHGKSIQLFLDTGDSTFLDDVAIQLTDRQIPDAWLLVERL